MASIVNIPLVMSAAALKVIGEHKIDIDQVCRDAVRREIESKIETSETVLSVNPAVRNEMLRTQVLQLQEQCARLIESGSPDWEKFL